MWRQWPGTWETRRLLWLCLSCLVCQPVIPPVPLGLHRGTDDRWMSRWELRDYRLWQAQEYPSSWRGPREFSGSKHGEDVSNAKHFFGEVAGPDYRGSEREAWWLIENLSVSDSGCRCQTGKRKAQGLFSKPVEGHLVDSWTCGHGTGDSFFHSDACFVPSPVLGAGDFVMNERQGALLLRFLHYSEKKADSS